MKIGFSAATAVVLSNVVVSEAFILSNALSPRLRSICVAAAESSAEGLDRRSILKAAAAAVVGGGLSGPSSAAASTDSAQLDGTYWDPYHPSGIRSVMVTGNTATIAGKDEPAGPLWKVRGCCSNRLRRSSLCTMTSQLIFWIPTPQLSGAVNGDEVLIDFSPKGGPKDLLGKFVATSADSTGIVFPDGNKCVGKCEPRRMNNYLEHHQQQKREHFLLLLAQRRLCSSMRVTAAAPPPLYQVGKVAVPHCGRVLGPQPSRGNAAGDGVPRGLRQRVHDGVVLRIRRARRQAFQAYRQAHRDGGAPSAWRSGLRL